MREAIHEAVEEVGRWHGALGYAKAVCTALGTIGVGVLVAFFAPADLREEIPVHREVGLGFMVFGVLFSLALFCDTGPGSIGQRAKSLLLGVITAGFAPAAAISQLGPYGLVGYALAVLVGLFSLFALWEVVTGKPGVTADP
jgi:hypothetical protein